MRKGEKKSVVGNSVLDKVAELKSKLHDIDQKLDHLIKNLRRFSHNHYNFDGGSA